ncbi:MAG: hypothetical protein KGY74_03945 [Candidatus Cloacimonetes bacterium]|nr:hypothetical protein [Candidatus Cloacimonadota bacterium]
MVLLIGFASIYAVFSLEKYYQAHLNKKLSQCQVILYLDSNSEPVLLKNQLELYNFVDNSRIEYNSQTLQKLEHNLRLHNIRKWLETENFPHILTFNLKGKKFSMTEFKQLIKKLSSDMQINKIDFNIDRIKQLQDRKNLLLRYGNYPFYVIGIVTILFIFLLVRLIRHKREQLWAQWRVIEKGTVYKIWHAFLEFLLSAVVLFALFFYPNYRWGKIFLHEFHITLFNYSPVWYWLGGIFLAYIIISSLNLIESKHKSL